MIAEVYPIKRMPRRFSFFDYEIPEALTLKRGDFVKIPFRNSVITGIVKEIRSTRGKIRKLKLVTGIITDISLASEDLAFYESLGKQTLQSIPSILHASIPPIPKRDIKQKPLQAESLKIRTSESFSIKNGLDFFRLHRKAFLTMPNTILATGLMLAYAHQKSHEQIAILVPQVTLAKQIAKFFATQSVSLITGKETSGQRHLAWQQFKKKETRILIGTRIASLLIPKNANTIFVLHSGDDNHKQWDQNPRYDARQNVFLLQEQSDANTYFIDTVPNVENMVRFGFENILTQRNPVKTYYIDLRNEIPVSIHPRLSYSLMNAIEEVLQEKKQIICVYNKKGVASGIRCQNCNTTFPCSQCGSLYAVYTTTLKCHRCGDVKPVPLSCPACKKTNLKEVGFGNQQIKKVLQTHLPDASVSIIDQNTQENTHSDILLVTQYYFQNIFDEFKKMDRVGLIADLDADIGLYESNVYSFEKTVRSVWHLRGIAYHLRTPCVIQTQIPQLFSEMESDPIKALEKEIQIRKEYQMPPFQKIISIQYKTEENREKDIVLTNLKRKLEKQFETMTIQGPHDQMLLLYVSTEIWDALSEELILLPDAFIIDTKPVL